MGSSRPLVFGEILCDVFEDGAEVLGGAPFNVAFHLQAWGLNPLMVSRVGEDARGARILDMLGTIGMDRSGIQVDPDHPTGTVQVSFLDGFPSYEIRPAAAWDFIGGDQMEAVLAAAEDCELVCAGTLALRSPVSRASFDHLAGKGTPRLLLDLNLRSPWWTRELVDSQIGKAAWLKLNQEELETVLGRAPGSPAEFRGRASDICRELPVELLAVTFGSAGAVLATPREAYSTAAPPVTKMIDSVGAGDGFTAALVRGILQRESVPVVLDSAVKFASRICGLRGATPADREWYQSGG